MDMEAWSAGIRCNEDEIAFCGRCRPRALPNRVLLVSGQERVTRRSGSVGVAEVAALQVAIRRGYFPCQGCFSEAGGRARGATI
jgi:hypothetical protein